MQNTSTNEEIKIFNKNYNFGEDLSIRIVLNEVCQFLDKDDIKRLRLLNKKINHSYCGLIKKVKINKEVEKINLEKLFNRYSNVDNLDLNKCKNIKDFTPISKLKDLIILDASYINITDILFIEKNSKIKELNLEFCSNITDFSPISKLEKLEILDVALTDITNISFLEKNRNIKELNLNYCRNITDFSPISKLKN